MSADQFNVEGPLTLPEIIKICALLENPAEAVNVRRALKFFDLPDRLKRSEGYQFGTNGSETGIMKMLFHFDNPQDPDELAWLQQHCEGKTSLLEVGSNFGGTLSRLASVMQVGSRIVSVDLDCDDTPKMLNPMASLRAMCRDISQRGAQVELFIGDSHTPELIEAVWKYAPFDFGFIDGDHSYEGVKADWEAYGPMCRAVGFHDIAGPCEGVARFWQELKASGRYVTDERINPETMLGVGIVYRDEGS